jgi:hypothetical protein
VKGVPWDPATLCVVEVFLQREDHQQGH